MLLKPFHDLFARTCPLHVKIGGGLAPGRSPRRGRAGPRVCTRLAPADV